MIRAAWRRAINFLRSARLATWLLAFVGAWSVVGTLVPQGDASLKAVSDFASVHPLAEKVIQALGLHQAFSSVIFIAAILVLGVSTALCAWERTRLAVGKARSLRGAAAADAASVTARHDIEIACDASLGGADALAAAAETLERLGIPMRRRDGVIANVSSTWSVWGSPVFHWALFALIAALIVGNLLRADGLMGVGVGETKPDEPASYGTVHAGPLYAWGNVHRSIRVDGFEPRYVSDGIDRGPTPSVSLLDGSGQVLVSQRVYPNATLKSGSISIYPADYGMSAALTLLNGSGKETAHASRLVDFSDTTRDGTVPVGTLVVKDSAGNPLLSIAISVPLDREKGALVKAIPSTPKVRVVATSLDGATALDRVIAVGQAVALPSGDDLRLDGLGYYARLSIVDDGSIPLLYAGLALAMLGLTLAVVVRQQIVLATVMETPEGVRLAVRVRLWRNSPSSRSEIESELTSALAGPEKGSTT